MRTPLNLTVCPPSTCTGTSVTCTHFGVAPPNTTKVSSTPHHLTQPQPFPLLSNRSALLEVATHCESKGNHSVASPHIVWDSSQWCQPHLLAFKLLCWCALASSIVCICFLFFIDEYNPTCLPPSPYSYRGLVLHSKLPTEMPPNGLSQLYM